MALSSVTVTINTRTVFGNKRVVFATLTLGDDTFPEAGLSLTPSQLGLEHIDLMLIEGKGLAYYYDTTNQLLKAYVPAAIPGPAVVRVAAANATPNESVQAIAVGYGG